MMRIRMCPTALGLGVLLSSAALVNAPLAAQSTPAAATVAAPRVFYACYVPLIGTVYLIKEPGLSLKCFGPATGPLANVPFSWTDGQGVLHSGAAAGGDLAGTYPDPLVIKLQGRGISATAPTAGQALVFDGTSLQWTPATLPSQITSHGALSGLAADDHPQYLLVSGTRAMAGALNLGGLQITGLGAATAAGDAVRYEQAVKSGDAAGGVLTGSYPNPGLATGVVTEGNLSFLPVHKAELDAQGQAVNAQIQATQAGVEVFKQQLQSTIGTINTTTNPVDWSQLKSVPSAVISGTGTATGTSANTPNTLVLRDAAGGFEAGALTLSGKLRLTSLAGVELGQGTEASGQASVALGFQTKASGNASTALGAQTIASGFASLAGGQASTASGNYAVALGYVLEATGRYSTAIGTEATTNDKSGAFVYGDASTLLTTGVKVTATTDNQFVVRAQHFWLGTTSDVTNPAGHFLTTSTGAYLTTGGQWTNTSDVNRKHLFQPADGEWALQRIAAMPIRTWSYKVESSGVRHLGPTAQDFHAAFGLGDSELAIGTVDADGVSLLAVQALEKRTRTLEQENALLRAELGLLKQRLDKVEAARK